MLERERARRKSGLDQPKQSTPSIGFFAPLPEQCRIVAKLDALLTRVKACRQRLDKIPKLLARFRQSVLAAACPEGCVQLKSVLKSIRGGSTAVPNSHVTQYPILRSSSVRSVYLI